MKVLVVKLSSLGDVLHTLPALTDAANALPGISFDWVVEEAFAEVPAWHPRVERVIPVAIRRWRRRPWLALGDVHWRRARAALGACTYDAVIDAQGLVKSALVARLARGPRVGMAWASAREPLASRAYQRRIAVPGDLHAVERVRRLFAAALQYPLPATVADYGIDDVALAPPPGPAPDLVFLHGTARREKEWPESHWTRLAQQAAGAGWSVGLPWGDARERERAGRIAAAAGAVAGGGDCRVLPPSGLAALGSLLRASRCAVAVDTGLGHMCAAFGVPALSLYGPTDPALVGTCGRSQVHLRAPATSKPANMSAHRMSSLPAEDAWRAVQGLLERPAADIR